jgi:hypothetical protein
MDEIVNKIEKSGLITIDLEDYYPKEKRIIFDLKKYLFEGLILKEKDFRQALSEQDWSEYENAWVAVTCSEAIIPSWAYLHITSYLSEVAKSVVFGSLEDLERDIYTHIIDDAIQIEEYQDKKVIIKGCSHKPVPQNAYLQLVQKLKPVVSSLMFGEACSTVPIYKKKKTD